MNRLNTILVPTDLSEHSRRALSYGYRLAAEDKAALVVLHVASELKTWELSTEFEIYTGNHGQVWPLDRILSEAALDLNHFLEPHIVNLRQIECATKRVVLGNIPERIAAVAEEFVDQIFADANAAAGDPELNPIVRFDADEGVEIVEAASAPE